MIKNNNFFSSLENESDLKEIAKNLIKEAGAEGILPTPLDLLYETAKIVNISHLPEEKEFLDTLSADAKHLFKRMKQKLRGIADLKTKISYVPKEKSPTRHRFTQAHELSHQVIEWHDVNGAYLDDNETLSPNTKKLFEREANFVGSELLFQGDLFRSQALDYSPALDVPLHLADLFDTSRHATIWKYIEALDEPVAVAMYYPLENGNFQKGAKLWGVTPSKPFVRRFAHTELPNVLTVGHEWLAAVDFNIIVQGSGNLNCVGENIMFEWSAWSNTYSLFVMIRRKPKLGFIGNIARDTQNIPIAKKLKLFSS